MSEYIPWIVLFSPLVSALVILAGARVDRTISAYISVTAVLVSFLGAWMLFLGPDFHLKFPLPWLDFSLPDAKGSGWFAWYSTGHAGEARFAPFFGASINALSKTMLIVVTTVGLLVHVYSLGYMVADKSKARYFAGLSMFMFSMLGIVLADNFVMMFIFWELVGVSSYLLIGHWFERPAAAAAANKAFLVNRIGDFGFMAGILMLWTLTGSVEFGKIGEALHGFRVDGALETTFLPYLTVATLLIFCGPMGKSAQVPLHVWLPDAMEGPTPVSALIHAATMVAAGVFLLARINFLLAVVPFTQEVIAWVGIVTAVLAALMATQQNDIKRVLAYSTLSQLGYMVCAVGVAAKEAAMFHLFTHAFFKALLFLGAGAIIHELHHEQNMWKMGGLRRRMPVTFWTFAIATLALVGCPFFSGFYSKDAILTAMSHSHKIMCGLGIFVAFLTSFYMVRLFVVVFLNKPMSRAAEHAHEAPAVMSWPLALLAVPSILAGYGFVGEHFGVGPGPRGEAPEGVFNLVPWLAVGVFVVGAASAFYLYAGKTADPIRIGLLRRKFYFDEFYAGLIRSTQDALAGGCGLIDRWVIGGAVRLVSGGVYGTGFILRFLQVGNLQAYAMIVGLGIVVFIYLAINL